MQNMDVNSGEISFPGLEAQIPGLVQVSIWTIVIRLAKQWQRVRPGSVARRRIRRSRHQWWRWQWVFKIAVGDAAESPERRCGSGWSLAVKVHQLLSCVGASSSSSFNDM